VTIEERQTSWLKGMISSKLSEGHAQVLGMHVGFCILLIEMLQTQRAHVQLHDKFGSTR